MVTDYTGGTQRPPVFFAYFTDTDMEVNNMYYKLLCTLNWKAWKFWNRVSNGIWKISDWFMKRSRFYGDRNQKIGSAIGRFAHYKIFAHARKCCDRYYEFREVVAP